MIPAEQVIEIITEQFPDISFSDAQAKLFQKFECIADYAISLLDEDNHQNMQRLLHLLAELMSHAEPVAVIAIENVFIYRLGTRIESDDRRKQLITFLPDRFLDTMVAQFTAPGI